MFHPIFHSIFHPIFHQNFHPTFANVFLQQSSRFGETMDGSSESTGSGECEGVGVSVDEWVSGFTI